MRNCGLFPDYTHGLLRLLMLNLSICSGAPEDPLLFESIVATNFMNSQPVRLDCLYIFQFGPG